MATVKRVRVTWTNFPGAPGVSTFYSDDTGTPNLPTIRALFDGLKGWIAGGVVMQVENQGQVVDTVTGKAVGNWAGPAQLPITATGTGGFAGPCGMEIRWRTGQFVNGREVAGKTFIVPLMAGQYDTQGSISDPTLAAAQTVVNTFVTSMGSTLTVLSRKGQAAFTVTSGKAVDKAVILRSRRS